MRIEHIDSDDGLAALLPGWTALWHRIPGATPFQSPGWLIPWWRHIGEGQLWTLACRSEGRLVGLAPLYIYRQPGTSRREIFNFRMASGFARNHSILLRQLGLTWSLQTLCTMETEWISNFG